MTVRLSLEGLSCVHCGATIGPELRCPGCGWMDPAVFEAAEMVPIGIVRTPADVRRLFDEIRRERIRILRRDSEL